MRICGYFSYSFKAQDTPTWNFGRIHFTTPVWRDYWLFCLTEYQILLENFLASGPEEVVRTKVLPFVVKVLYIFKVLV